jgi:type II secretory pathway component PulK
MIGRRGFALPTILWFLALLSVLVVTKVAPVLMAQEAGYNRQARVRARWAALGCLDLVRARVSQGRLIPRLDSVSLGPIVWCRIEWLDPSHRVNPNVADSIGLQRVLPNPVQVASVLDWVDPDDDPRPNGAESDWYVANGRLPPRNGPIRDVAELRLIRGVGQASLDDLEKLFTTRGAGAVSVRAPAIVVSSVSVLSREDVEILVVGRERWPSLDSPEQLLDRLQLDLSTAQFRELSRRLTFSENERTVRAHGFVNMGKRMVEVALTVDLRKGDDGLHVTRVDVR